MAKPGKILLVEDNPADAKLVQLALRRFPALSLDVVEDGDAAIDYLGAGGAGATAERPDLVLLDLNLPKRHGLCVLDAIRGDAELTSLPVVVLTSSEAEEDILKAYVLHANSYVTKPADFSRWQAIVDELESYWFDTVKLPGR